MYIKKFLKNYCLLFIVLILMLGCEGNDCVEANDFGESDSDIVIVNSKQESCDWTDDNGYGSGSMEVASCLDKNKTSFSISSSNCIIKPKGGGSTNCNRLKECLSIGDFSCVSWFSFSGSSCDSSETEDSEKKSLIQSAYSSCLENCINECTDSNQNYETDWEPNNFKSTKGGIGINITSSQKINLQVTGTLSLLGSQETSESFSNLNDKNVQTKTDKGDYLNFATGVPLTLKGKWCRNSNYSLDNCPIANQIGEFGGDSSLDNTDFTKRTELLRRGVLILEPLPLNSSFNDGIYKGVLQEPNFNSWKCDMTLDSFSCKSDYSGIPGITNEYVTQNDETYHMNNNFTKIIGGYVIPENVIKYITTNPFENLYCSTKINPDSGENIRDCNKELPSYQVDTSGTSPIFRNGYFLNRISENDSSIGLTINSIIYPARIAFRIVPDIGETKAGSGKCTLTVLAPNLDSEKIVEVEADGNWYFLTDEKNDRILLNKTNYNTIRKLDNTSYQNFNNKNAYSIVVKAKNNETWSDNNGKVLPCGQGVGVFLFPQNEILMEKSGFVDFKNILATSPQSLVNCLSGDNSNYTTCINPSNNKAYNLSFEIINPMYDLLDSSSGIITDANKTILNNNFYEYKDDYGNPEKQSVGVTVQADGGIWTNSSIFVRKGQILSFDENNWFDISKVNRGYTIKNKVMRLRYSDITNLEKIGNGLAIKITERPALLCLGSAEEMVTNAACLPTKNEAGDTECQVSYTEFCAQEGVKQKFNKLNPEGKEEEVELETYCPFGCYGDLFVENSINNTACSIDPNAPDGSDAKTIAEQFKDKINRDKCQNCKDFLETKKGTVSSEYGVEIIQCYDLEDYTGSVNNITKIDITNDSEKDIEKYGNLSKTDIRLGAKKLTSIFDGGTYGNLDNLELDISQKDSSTGKYSNFIYNSTSNLPFQTPRNVRFLLIDNENFKFKEGYTKNKGKYELGITPVEIDKNGSQMAIVLAEKDWDQSEGFSGGKFKSWVVKYDFDKTANDGQSYGKLAHDSPYKIDSNGLIVDNSTGGNEIDISSLNISGVQEDDYKDLRLFFKIIDKKEPKDCDGDNFKVPYTKTMCKCEGESNSRFRSCDEITCKDNVNIIAEERKISCISSYYNNTGAYTVQLKTPKDGLNSTGYIVKYVMEPILEVLDGKTIGLRVGTNGKFLPCQSGDVTYKYGGDLPKFRIGTVCSKTDPLAGKYCMETTAPYKTCLATSTTPINCLLPGANLDKYGENCYDNNGNFRLGEGDEKYCFPIKTKRCNIYKKNVESWDNSFGDHCEPSEENCYQNCSTLDTNLYRSQCVYVNDGGGFIQRFYTNVINDRGYQIILRLCFTLMIMFYGMYYLMGMADLTHGELIKRAIKISFIYLMVGKDGWYYYNMFFVKFFKEGVDYLVFAIAGAFDNSSNLQQAFVKNDFYDKSVLFSGVDKNLALLFSDQVSFKIWGLLFVSFFGWLYVFLIYVSILAYITAVANALLLYLTAQFFISMLLSFGPIFFVLLIFEKTKGMFDKWINNLIGFSFEQIFLLTCLSLFNSLIYNVIKFVLSYRVCWRPIWILNIPLLGNIELMSFWKATSASSPTAAASAVPGLFQILIIYLVADFMKNFIEFMSDMGVRIGGGDLMSSGMSDDIKSSASSFYKNNISEPFKKQAKGLGTMAAKKLIGYKTEDESKSENKSNKILNKGIRKANKDGNKALEKYRKEHMEELLAKPVEERNKILANVRDDAVTKSMNTNSALTEEAKKRGISDLKDRNASNFTYSLDGNSDLISSLITGGILGGNRAGGVASNTTKKQLETGKLPKASGIKDGNYSKSELNKFNKSKNQNKGDDKEQDNYSQRQEVKTDTPTQGANRNDENIPSASGVNEKNENIQNDTRQKGGQKPLSTSEAKKSFNEQMKDPNYRKQFNNKVKERSAKIKGEAKESLQKKYPDKSALKIFNKDYRDLKNKEKNSDKIAENELKGEAIKNLEQGEKVDNPNNAANSSERLESPAQNNTENNIGNNTGNNIGNLNKALNSNRGEEFSQTAARDTSMRQSPKAQPVETPSVSEHQSRQETTGTISPNSKTPANLGEQQPNSVEDETSGNKQQQEQPREALQSSPIVATEVPIVATETPVVSQTPQQAKSKPSENHSTENSEQQKPLESNIHSDDLQPKPANQDRAEVTPDTQIPKGTPQGDSKQASTEQRNSGKREVVERSQPNQQPINGQKSSNKLTEALKSNEGKEVSQTSQNSKSKTAVDRDKQDHYRKEENDGTAERNSKKMNSSETKNRAAERQGDTSQAKNSRGAVESKKPEERKVTVNETESDNKKPKPVIETKVIIKDDKKE